MSNVQARLRLKAFSCSLLFPLFASSALTCCCSTSLFVFSPATESTVVIVQDNTHQEPQPMATSDSEADEVHPCHTSSDVVLVGTSLIGVPIHTPVGCYIFFQTLGTLPPHTSAGMVPRMPNSGRHPSASVPPLAKINLRKMPHEYRKVVQRV